MSLTRWVTALAGLGCLLLTGCETAGQSSAGQTSTETSPPSAASTTTTTEGGQTGGPASCPVGTWKLADLRSTTSLNGVEAQFSGSGSMMLTMSADNTWTLTDDGSQPLSAQLASSGVSVAGTLTVDGSAEGNYMRAGEQFGFQVERTEGTAELKSDVLNQTFDMDQVTGALVPTGRAEVTCSGSTLRIGSGSFTMTWNFVGEAQGTPTTTS